MIGSDNLLKIKEELTVRKRSLGVLVNFLKTK